MTTSCELCGLRFPRRPDGTVPPHPCDPMRAPSEPTDEWRAARAAMKEQR